MKHIFIINPIAGTGNAKETFLPKIMEQLDKQDFDYKVHVTTKRDDARRFVERLISFRKDENEVLRFYSCGGDGTLNEVLNGIGSSKNVQLACIPAGTGNDFIRNFGDAAQFRNIKTQMEGQTQKVDVMECILDGKKKTLGINLINMGLDCEATKNMDNLKKSPIFRGSAGYIVGAAKAFIQLVIFSYRVFVEGAKEFDGDITLLAVGNGTTYGGGFKAAPKAKVSDGLLDLCLVERINRRQFIKLIGPYRKGEHLAKDKDQVIRYKQMRSVRIESDRGIEACVDGELIYAKTLEISVLPQAIEFVVPSK